MGYHLAGFDVVGVDIKPQPRYPFEFHQGDAMTWPLEGFDAIHASPPCQRWSSATCVSGSRESHPDFIAGIRERLTATRKPYVIENVPRAPLLNPVLLCGVERGLKLGPYVLRRHRLFEISFGGYSNGCGCYRGDGVTLGVYGGGTTFRARGSASAGGRPYKGRGQERKVIMGMDWCKTHREVNEAIPPAYTKFIGEQLMRFHLDHDCAGTKSYLRPSL